VSSYRSGVQANAPNCVITVPVLLLGSGGHTSLKAMWRPGHRIVKILAIRQVMLV
jgi:hypothetical protein